MCFLNYSSYEVIYREICLNFIFVFLILMYMYQFSWVVVYNYFIVMYYNEDFNKLIFF